jgi:hypothetical protein
MRRARALIVATAAAAILSSALCSCATPPAPAAEPAPAVASAASQEREVSWDESVRADFSREVPRFAQKLANAKLEEMARDKGTYFVDRALYDEAMAQYKR